MKQAPKGCSRVRQTAVFCENLLLKIPGMIISNRQIFGTFSVFLAKIKESHYAHGNLDVASITLNTNPSSKIQISNPNTNL